MAYSYIGNYLVVIIQEMFVSVINTCCTLFQWLSNWLENLD